MKTGRRVGGAAGAVALAVLLLAGCSDDAAPRADSTSAPPTSPSVAPTTSDPSPSLSPTSAVPSYIPPPRRSVPRPAGLILPPNTCGYATTTGHAVVAGWESSTVAYVRDGDEVPDSQWAEAVRVLPSKSFFDAIQLSRTNLQQAGVPSNHLVFRDLGDLEAAIRSAITVARARDESQVMPIYFRLRTAFDHFGESCGVLEGPAGN